MTLLLVEWRRLFSRRAVVLLLLGSVLVTGIIAGGVVWNTRPASPAELAQARQRAQQLAQQPDRQQTLTQCRQNPAQFFGPDATPAVCEQRLLPQAQELLTRSPLSLDEARTWPGLAVALIVVALLVLVGATFAGADWSSGSISNQLLFVPDRRRVWRTKTTAVFLLTLASSAIVLAEFWLVLWLAAQARGITTPTSVLTDIGWMTARVALLAGLSGASGFALTMLLRRTAGTLGLLLAYAVGGELLLQALGAPRWKLSTNLQAWIKNGHEYVDPSITCRPGQPCDQLVTLSLQQAAAYLGTLILAVLVVSLLHFRHTDVP